MRPPDAVHNVRVRPTPRPARSGLTRVALPAALLGLLLAGCSDPTGEPEADSTISDGATADEPAEEATESPTAEVSVPDDVAVTAQGSDLEFRDPATVVFEPDQRRDTLLELTVTKAREGRLRDFEGFILDDSYKKKASYYYVDVSVENVGEGDVGGAPVPLWGVNGDNTLLPAVSFTTKFRLCDSTPLPKKFQPGDSIDTCLVYLSPDKGTLESLSFRPDQAFDPIEWTGEIKPPKKDPKGKKGNKGKNNNGRGGSNN